MANQTFNEQGARVACAMLAEGFSRQKIADEYECDVSTVNDLFGLRGCYNQEPFISIINEVLGSAEERKAKYDQRGKRHRKPKCAPVKTAKAKNAKQPRSSAKGSRDYVSFDLKGKASREVASNIKEILEGVGIESEWSDVDDRGMSWRLSN